MSNKVKVSEELRKKYEEAYFDEVKFGILYALQKYDSLNLKRLAQLVDRPETTTLRYIKQLLIDKLIDVDAKKTATSWGKFYQLSREIMHLVAEESKQAEERERDFLANFSAYKEKSDEEIDRMIVKEVLSKERFDHLIAGVKHQIAFTHNMQRIIINEFSQSVSVLQKLMDKKGKEYLEKNLILEPSDILTTSFVIKLSKSRHLLKFFEMYMKFFLELEKLKEEIAKDMEREKLPEEKQRELVIHTFAGTTNFKHRMRDEE